jgi:hypothetical protein
LILFKVEVVEDLNWVETWTGRGCLFITQSCDAFTLNTSPWGIGSDILRLDFGLNPSTAIAVPHFPSGAITSTKCRIEIKSRNEKKRTLFTVFTFRSMSQMRQVLIRLSGSNSAANGVKATPSPSLDTP